MCYAVGGGRHGGRLQYRIICKKSVLDDRVREVKQYSSRLCTILHMASKSKKRRAAQSRAR